MSLTAGPKRPADTLIRDHMHSACGMDGPALAALLEQGRETLESGVGQLVRRTLAALDKTLAELAGNHPGGASPSALPVAVDRVRTNRDLIEEVFGQAFAALFAHRLAGHAGPLPPQSAGKHELALVDDAFMRDKLMVENLVQRTRGHLDSDEVLGMRARLGVLAGRDWFDEAAFPGSPGTVYESLQLAIDRVEIDSTAKSALLGVIEPHVSAGLNAVYVQVNAEWRAAGLLPAIKPRVAINPDSGRATRDGHSPSPTKPGETRPVARSGVPGRDAADTFILPPDGPEREAILAILAQQVADGGDEARRSAIRMLAEPINFAMADLPEPGAGLIDALSSMQAQQPQNALDIQREFATITSRARDSGSPLDQLTIEIVALIFDFLHEDPRTPDPVKYQLGRLQVVAVKAALLDRSFFASRQHPMRRLIDRATDVACDPQIDASPQAPFIVGLSGVVDDVLSRFERDLRIFDEAVDHVEALASHEIERHAQAVTEIADAAEREERRAACTREAEYELNQRIDGQTPEFTKVFLLDVWVGVMVAAQMDPDGTAVGRAERLATAEQLLWSVGPRTATEMPQLAAMLPRLIGGLNRGLQSVGASTEQVDRFLKELMGWHTRTIRVAKLQAAPSAIALGTVRRQARLAGPLGLDEHGEVRFLGAPATDSPAPLVPEPIRPEDAAIAMLVRGQRFELRQAAQPVILCKLAWISPARQLFALARFPDFARSYDRERLARMLLAAELVAVATVPSLDRAIDAVGRSGDDQRHDERVGDRSGSVAGLVDLDVDVPSARAGAHDSNTATTPEPEERFSMRLV